MFFDVCCFFFFLFYENGSLVQATFRALSPFYGRDDRPAESTILRLVGRDQSTRGSPNGNTSEESDCLVRIYGCSCDWSVFFRKQYGVAVTVNGERYRSMITNFIWPEIENMELDNMWFQQDWPPRSCDLTPLFHLGFSQVHDNKAQDTDVLKVNIRHAIDQIQPDLCAESSKIGHFVHLVVI